MKNQLESGFFMTSKHLYWNKHCNEELSNMESCMVYISSTLNINHCYFYIKNTTSEISIYILYLVIHHTHEEANRISMSILLQWIQIDSNVKQQ